MKKSICFHVLMGSLLTAPFISFSTLAHLEPEFIAYYNEQNGLKGNDLKKALGKIAAKNHTPLTYSQVWDALKYTNEDPHNKKNVILLYSGRSQSKELNSSLSKSQSAWNREHVWPISLGFKKSHQWGYTDLHHLQPADAKINAIRGNKDFDFGGSPVSKSPINKTDGDSFDPRDAVKGDIARSLFYMAVRYEGTDASMPDLILVNDTTSKSGDSKLGKLCTLLDWNKVDPVDEWEKTRHKKVVERQGNRNPFIDNPNWAEDIYGSRCIK